MKKFIIITFFALVSCTIINPEEQNTDQIIEVIPSATSVNTLQLVTLTITNAVLEDSYPATFGASEIELVRDTDSTIFFIVPYEQAEGKTLLEFRIGTELISKEFTVYSARIINNPDVLFSNWDEDLKTAFLSDNLLSQEAKENALVGQSYLDDAMDIISTMTADQKSMLADYIYLNQGGERTYFKKTSLIEPDEIQNGNEAAKYFKVASAKLIVISTFIAIDISMTQGCLYIPEPIVSKAAALITTAALVGDIVKLLDLIEEVYSYKGIFVDFVLDEGSKKSIEALTSYEFYNGEPTPITFSADFRSIYSIDLESTSDIIKGAAVVINTFAGYYNRAKQIISDVIDFFSFGNDNIKNKQAEGIRTFGSQETYPILAEFLEITDIQPATVSLLEKEVDNELVFLTFSTDETGDIDFTFNLSYFDEMISKDVSIEGILLQKAPCVDGSVTIGGVRYRTVCFDGTEWMVTNLKLEVPGSTCFDSNCTDYVEGCESEYGRRYTYEQARDAADLVDGWRLPTIQEADELLSLFGEDPLIRYNNMKYSSFDPALYCYDTGPAGVVRYQERASYILSDENSLYSIEFNSIGAYVNYYFSENFNYTFFVRLVKDK